MPGEKDTIMYETHTYSYGKIGKIRIVYYNLPEDKVKQIKAWFKAIIPKVKATYSRSKKKLEIKYSGTREEVDSILALIVKILYDVIYRGVSLEQAIQGMYGVVSSDEAKVVVKPKPKNNMNTTIPYY